MNLGPIQFSSPQWLVLVPPLIVVVWWISRRSMGGLGRRTKLVAIVLRVIVLTVLVSMLAGPSWRRTSDDVAVTIVFDTSRSIPTQEAQHARDYIERASANATPHERLGVVSTAEEPLVQALPSARVRSIEIGHTGGNNATDLASGVRLAMAVAPEDAASRLVVVTDGNETSGSLLEAAESARASSIPIDVLPIRYNHDTEVSLERLIVPATARQGESVPVRFVLQSTHATTGRLTLMINGKPVDLDAQSEALSSRVDLEPGVNVRSVPVVLPSVGAHRFEAFFEPSDEADDSIAENNDAQGVTFITSEGRVLVYVNDVEAATPLLDALDSSSVELEIRSPFDGHQTLEELAGFDAIILVDISADTLTFQQQDELRVYVHDIGGGLLVIGGENSYGAGGWIGSPLAQALPIKLDPPQKRELPRGALALIMHSCEMPRGNYWGKETGKAAIDSLTSKDVVGILEYSWEAGGATWVHKLSLLGNKVAARQAMENLTFGDMPDFNQAMLLALRGLQNVKAGAKHCIIISDGDPSGPGSALTQKFIDAGISVSTVAVFPHSSGPNGPDVTKMRKLAFATGGQFYYVGTGSALKVADLPQIFIREARTIKRSLIWEGLPFVPKRVLTGSETMRGIDSVPALNGYIVAGDRGGLSQVTLRGKEDDPILAQWQHGLGRVVAFMSDATTRWNSAWIGWDGFAPFWEAHLRWIMRPGGSQQISITTLEDGRSTRVIVDALDNNGERLNFAHFEGRVVGPNLDSQPISLQQTGPGRYEGLFKSLESGAYVMNLRYNTIEGGEPVRGAVQASVIRAAGAERRALRDNSALLQQVADRTGGRVLNPDPRQANLFVRENLPVPISLQPIWLLVALLSCGLFLADVAVRRVRIDIFAAILAFRRGFGQRQGASAQQLSALRDVKQRARQEMQESSQTASVKFEADASYTPTSTTVETSLPSEAPKATPDETKSDNADDGETGLSRLKKAKRRARESMEDDV
jgi:uncharacterized membrane protein